MHPDRTSFRGFDAFVRAASHLAWLAYIGRRDSSWFIRSIGSRFAFIRLEDLGRPRKFLAQMAGAPPDQFGTAGFRHDLVDDRNPARHYSAFVFVGFYVPTWAGALVLLAWESAGFIRYDGHWSRADMRSGWIGLRHGRLVRKHGATVLPGLIAAQLADR